MANTPRRRTQRSSRAGTRIAPRNSGPSAAAAAAEAEKTHSGNVAHWQIEMGYINKDLRELLVISAILFALLFVVGFLL